MAKKRQKKPTGTTGALRLGGNSDPEYRRFALPLIKRDAERVVLEMAWRDARASGRDLNDLLLLTEDPKQNLDENGFDYLLSAREGQQYLDLMEVAPPRGVGAHDKAPWSYVQGERVDEVLHEVLRKSAGYGPVPRAVIHLLLYAADWRFHLGENGAKLLAAQLSRHPHSFKTILYYELIDDRGGAGQFLYPAPDGWLAGLDELPSRQRRVARGALPEFAVTPDGAVEIPLGPLQRPGPGPGTLSIRVKLADNAATTPGSQFWFGG